jgi:hypothetical protein
MSRETQEGITPVVDTGKNVLWDPDTPGKNVFCLSRPESGYHPRFHPRFPGQLNLQPLTKNFGAPATQCLKNN